MENCSLMKIEIDGKILLDNGVTPVDNVPSIAATGCSVGTKQGFSIIKYTSNLTQICNYFSWTDAKTRFCHL